MKRKPKKLAILRCKCGAMNHLSKVRHGENFQPIKAIIECSETGYKWELGADIK